MATLSDSLPQTPDPTGIRGAVGSNVEGVRAFFAGLPQMFRENPVEAFRALGSLVLMAAPLMAAGRGAPLPPEEVARTTETEGRVPIPGPGQMTAADVSRLGENWPGNKIGGVESARVQPLSYRNPKPPIDLTEAVATNPPLPLRGNPDPLSRLAPPPEAGP